MRPTPHDDDEVSGLPATDGDDSVADTAPLEGLEPELTSDSDESEDVGLDAEAGIDEPFDTDLDAEFNAGVEGESLLEGSEESTEIEQDEDEPEPGDEYGWTDESEPLEDPSLYEGAIVLVDEASALSDRGEEGFGDDLGASALDLESLPPLDAGDDDEIGDGELGDDELGDEGLGRASESPAAPSASSAVPATPLANSSSASGLSRPPAWSEPPQVLEARAEAHARIRVELLQRSGRPLRALASAGVLGIAWDGSLRVAEGGGQRPDRRYAEAEIAMGLEAMHHAGVLSVALLTPEALLVSVDGGRHFAARSDFPERSVPSTVSWLQAPSGGSRLLAAAPHGKLWASDDGGPFFALEPLTGIVRVRSDGVRSVLAVVRGAQNQPLLAHSTDSGQSFELAAAPCDSVERIQEVSVAGNAVLCARRGVAPHVLWRQEENFYGLLDESGGPICVLHEREGLAAYARATRAGEPILIRRRLPLPAHASEEALGPVEEIAAVPRELGALLQLAGAHEDGVTTLHLGTERAWLRVTILPGGGDA